MRKITISLEEKETLKKALKNSSSPIFNQRIECILLASNLGLIAPKLATHFEVTSKTIYYWFNLWEKKGIDGLKHQPGQGCKKKLASVSKEDLKALLEANSQNIKEVLVILSSKYKISASKSTLIRFLKM